MYFVFQAEDGIRDLVRSRGLGDVYKRQDVARHQPGCTGTDDDEVPIEGFRFHAGPARIHLALSLIHI